MNLLLTQFYIEFRLCWRHTTFLKWCKVKRETCLFWWLKTTIISFVFIWQFLSFQKFFEWSLFGFFFKNFSPLCSYFHVWLICFRVYFTKSYFCCNFIWQHFSKKIQILLLCQFWTKRVFSWIIQMNQAFLYRTVNSLECKCE